MTFEKKVIFTITIAFLPFLSKGQYGGWASYSFLKGASDAFTTSLGGQQVSPISNDPSLYLNNPSLNDSIKKHYLKINFAPLWAGTSSSTISYGRKLQSIGNLSASLQYINYGSFQGTDAAGNLTNVFNANDFALTIGHARKVNNISIGLNLKLVGSTIDTYSAYAILADFGGYFKHPKKEISYGLAIKNMGARLKNFSAEDSQELPFDVQMGFTIRPEHMPFRFSINAHHLHQWNILIEKSAQIDLLSNQKTVEETTFAGKLASHLIFGIEAFAHKNFQINVGYNNLLRNELKFDNLFTMAGFSAGIMIKTKKLNVGIGSQGIHPARGLTQISIFTPLK
ncbi:MAG: type IX secretion system protein PorQ [Bacteroidota bacterium]